MAVQEKPIFVLGLVLPRLSNFVDVSRSSWIVLGPAGTARVEEARQGRSF